MYTRYTIHACLRSDNYCCCFENDPHLSLFCLVMMSSSKNSVLCVQSVKVMNQLLAPLDPPFPFYFFFSFSPKGIASRPNANKNNTWSDSLTHSVAKEKCISYNTSPWFPFLKVKIKSIFYNWE